MTPALGFRAQEPLCGWRGRHRAELSSPARGAAGRCCGDPVLAEGTAVCKAPASVSEDALASLELGAADVLSTGDPELLVPCGAGTATLPEPGSGTRSVCGLFSLFCVCSWEEGKRRSTSGLGRC